MGKSGMMDIIEKLRKEAATINTEDLQSYYHDLEKYGDKERPQFLYKYRRADNENDLMFLTESIVYFPSPIRFEDDEKDCRLPKQYPHKKRDVIRLIKQDLHKKHPELNDLNLTLMAKRIDSPLLKPEELKKKEYEYQEVDNDTLGVLSLTKSFANDYMWEKYGGNSTGFCIKYDTNLLFECTEGFIHSVSYKEKLPIISPFEDYWMNAFLTNYFTKRIDPFCKEEEWRIVNRAFNSIDDENRRFPIQPKCINAVYLGTKMCDKHKSEITKLVHEKYGFEPIDLSKE